MKQSNHIIDYFKTNINSFNLSDQCKNPSTLLIRLNELISYVQNVGYGSKDPNKYFSVLQKRDLIANHFYSFIQLIKTLSFTDDTKFSDIFYKFNELIGTLPDTNELFQLTLFNNQDINNIVIAKTKYTKHIPHSKPNYNKINFNDISQIEVIILILYYINCSLEILISNIIPYTPYTKSK